MVAFWFRFRTFIKSFFNINFVNLTFFFLISFFCIVLPAIAEDDCITYNPPAEWKNHFPFDLIYPIGQTVDPATECPVINFWGEERTVCSIKTLTAIVKNVFLFRVVIHSLFTL